ncbi:MAG TPA: phosphomannomutase/phosphoglucomutase [Thermoleophilia bacterium]|nr:phosphomannomutase/phosphoglucomutase [Thermoleophilia bacterium]
MTHPVPAGIFKAYDVRGLYPSELDESVAERIGFALARQLEARSLGVGTDPRPSSPGIAEAFATGAARAGASVTEFGMVATEMVYFGVASRGLDGGAMVTASHNPPQYNGLKLVGEGALPLSGEAGMPELSRRVQAARELPPVSGTAVRDRVDLYDGYVRHLHGFVDVGALAPYRVVMDAANGIAGALAPRVFAGTPVRAVEMYFEVDGAFPNHEPNPLLEENRREIIARVLAERADLGIAWDGDGDRCFFIDETGEFVPGDFVTALLAEALLLKEPGAAILYDLRASRAVPDTIRAAGGVPLINRVGHAFFKQRMRREPVLFGGEVSGHYYFRDNFNADSGFIPALLILELLSQKKATLAELLEPLRSRYFISGEINSTVDDVAAALARIEERFGDGEVTKLDGVSVDHEHWHFNVRPSNTEPLLRLNLGADSRELMEEKRDLVLSVIGA